VIPNGITHKTTLLCGNGALSIVLNYEVYMKNIEVWDGKGGAISMQSSYLDKKAVSVLDLEVKRN
jgi:hypothetical protein